MCDFKPGDEVVCVSSTFHTYGEDAADIFPTKGQVYTVHSFVSDDEGVWVVLCEVLSHLYDPSLFRKVQRRDLSAWLETAATDTDKWDKPIKTPARPKVDALLQRVQSGAFG